MRTPKAYAKTDAWCAPIEGDPPAFIPLSGRKWQVWVDASRVDARFLESYSYYDFVELPGTVLKDERWTRISRIQNWAGTPNGEPVDLILKLYRYSNLALPRTMYAYPKAQREFDGLHYCHGLGEPAVDPVAWGVERTTVGMVRSCFVITKYVRDSVTLRDWLKAGHFLEPEGRNLLAQVMSEMGGCFRRMHGAGFFHLRPATKDFLVYTRADGRLSWSILDFSHARFLGWGAPARWAQKTDLGTLLASVSKYSDAAIFDAFWSSYLPDPVGEMLPEDLLRRARQKEQALLHRNVIHRVERYVKRWMRRH